GRRHSTGGSGGASVLGKGKGCHYTVLGVARSATAKDIRQAYRKLALKFHPDKNSEAGAADKFKEVTEAYEIIGDESARRKYDSDVRLGRFC
ncbi:hypothetical protein JKP88DRAFT_197076, partial [Tribonema minus]